MLEVISFVTEFNHRIRPQNTTQKSIFIVFCVSSIRHDSSLSKYRKQKQSPSWTCAVFSISRGWLLLFTVLAEWRIMTNRAYAKNIGDGLLCSILWLHRSPSLLFLRKRYSSWLVTQQVPYTEAVTPWMCAIFSISRGCASVYGTCWVTNHDD
jgi:hypothetical protein